MFDYYKPPSVFAAANMTFPGGGKAWSEVPRTALPRPVPFGPQGDEPELLIVYLSRQDGTQPQQHGVNLNRDARNQETV